MSQKVKATTPGGLVAPLSTYVNAAPEAGQIAGRWYGMAGAGSTSLLLVSNRLYMVPLMVHRRRRPASIGVYVTVIGSTGALLRFGIYQDNGDGTPTTVLVDSGTVSGEAVGMASVNLAVDLDPGLWWLGVVGQGAPTTQPTLKASTQASPLVGLVNPTNVGAPGYYSSSTVSGALPNISAANPLDATTAPSVALKL